VWEQELKYVVDQCNLLIDSKTEELDDNKFTQCVVPILSAAWSLTDLMINIPTEPNKFRQFLNGLGNDKIVELVHDVRVPLNSILVLSELIGVGEIAGQLTEQQHEYLQVIFDIAQELHKWLMETFNIARIESGSPPHYDFFDITETLTEMVQLISDSPCYTGKFSTIKLIVFPGIPEVYADARQTKQAILSIIKTVANFTVNGALTIQAESFTDNLYVKISVVDTGSGVEPEIYDCMLHDLDDDSPVVTLRDKALKERREKAKPTQITDLTSAQVITHHQGGKFWFESELGVKSAFYFTIPTQPQQDK
jgi:signal transduction histidine kinase